MRDIMKLLQQAQEMQGQYQKIQEELQQMTLTGTAGGGMVNAEVNGQGMLKRVKIDPSVINPSDTEMLEDLITVAVSDAQRKAQEQAQAQVSKLAGGLNLPFKLPF
ncbi:MAG TPA: YbaB/EbfC family nucleoid-associated protein [Gemmatimonadaceae bacterium]|nr:YbaB/EbfC family nucleoid-associated protein [Gemmatimonadaceae bacterium]